MKLKTITYILGVFLLTLAGAFVVDHYVLHRQHKLSPPLIQQPSKPSAISSSVSIEEALLQVKKEELKKHLYYLASDELGGRKPGTDGFHKAEEHVERYCVALGLKTERQNVPQNDYNIIASIEGKDPQLKNEIIVVGAHLDHLGTQDVIYHGADDNGSGSTALMGVAKVLAKAGAQRRTIVLQWYTAEEKGLIGSHYYVNHPMFPQSKPDIRKHIAMINLDMVGRLNDSHNTTEVLETSNRPKLRPNQTQPNEIKPENNLTDINHYAIELKKKYNFKKSLINSSGGGSDHVSFLQKGVPTVFLCTGLHSDYHKTTDTADKIDYDGLDKIARYAAELAYRCASAGANFNEIKGVGLSYCEDNASLMDHDMLPFPEPSLGK